MPKKSTTKKSSKKGGRKGGRSSRKNEGFVETIKGKTEDITEKFT